MKHCHLSMLLWWFWNFYKMFHNLKRIFHRLIYYIRLISLYLSQFNSKLGHYLTMLPYFPPSPKDFSTATACKLYCEISVQAHLIMYMRDHRLAHLHFVNNQIQSVRKQPLNTQPYLLTKDLTIISLHQKNFFEDIYVL